jgi:hypothetical protein
MARRVIKEAVCRDGWDTVGLPRDVFRSLVRPLRHFTWAAAPVDERCPF